MKLQDSNTETTTAEEVTKETCQHKHEDLIIYGDDARDMMCTKCGIRFWDCSIGGWE